MDKGQERKTMNMGRVWVIICEAIKI